MIAMAMLVAACGARHTTGPVAPQANTPATASSTAAGQGTGEDTAARPGERVYDLEGIRIEVAGRTAEGEPELVAYDAQGLLDTGNDALARGRPDEAMAQYEKLVASFPGSRLVPAAIYNLGLAHEARGEYDQAIARYRRLAEDPALDRDGVEAHQRIAAVLAELGRWSEARDALTALLARNNLTYGDHIEGLARLGYVALEQQEYAAAETHLRAALDVHAKMTGTLDSLYFVAMSRYYLAQIPHRQFRAMPMRLPDKQLERDLAAKAELVALAYDRYVEALQVTDAYWGTAAGYQMSQIYKELWDDIVAAPIPTQLSPEAAVYYVKEVHARVRGMLEKAMDGHLRNVELAGVYGTSTEWSEASRVRADEIAALLAREASGELVVPEPVTAGTPAGSSGDATEAPSPGQYVPARPEL
jgi:tetratricopeptide (TPR) repeat protein